MSASEPRPPRKETPRLYEVKGGWHAAGSDFAVFGRTRDEALAAFWAAIQKHHEILNRGEPIR